MVSCWGVSKHIQSKSMTTHRTDPELLNTILQLLTDQGATGGLAEGIRLLVNEAMRQERSQALQAQPYQRTQTRQGQANGFKPKTLGTRLGSIQFRIPQVRGGLEFYPSALEKGVRSEQALMLALAPPEEALATAPAARARPARERARLPLRGRALCGWRWGDGLTE